MSATRDLAEWATAAGAQAVLCVVESPGNPPVQRVLTCARREGADLTLTSPFLAGSQAKMYTAASIALLVDSHALKLETQVHHYVPECPVGIDVRALLTHTSGLGDHVTAITARGLTPRLNWSTSDLVTLAVGQRVAGTTGEYAYSNTGYLLLALLIERISGTSHAEFAARRIFAPLGMRSTSFVKSDAPAVQGLLHQLEAGLRASACVRISAFELFALASGSGDLITTLADSLAFGRALLSGHSRLGLHVSSDRAGSLPGIQSFALHGLEVFGHRAQFVATSSATVFAPATGAVIAYCVQHHVQPNLKPSAELQRACEAMVELGFNQPCCDLRVS